MICDLDEFKNQINNLVAVGGDDCREASNQAIRKALLHFSVSPLEELPGGNVILHTDAPAQNPGSMNSIIFLAQRKRVKINFNITDGCVDDSKNKNGNNQKHVKVFQNNLHQFLSENRMYQQISDETGGVSYKVLKEELDSLIPITLFITEPETEMFFSQKLFVDFTKSTESILKVDSSISAGSTMLIIKTIEGSSLPTITITRPNGTLVLDSDDNVKVTNLTTLVAYKIDLPETGDWKIALSNGSSTNQIKAFAQTDFSITGLSFLKSAPLNIRGVELMPFDGKPIVGEELVLRIDFTKTPDSLVLTFQRDNQTILMQPILTLIEGLSSAYETTFNVPNEEFSIKLTGNYNESQFQREIPLSIKPTTIKLNFDNEFDFLNLNLNAIQSQIKTFNLHITNVDSNDATYSLNTYLEQDYPITIQEQITVPAGQTATVPISVSIPIDAIVGSTDEIMIIVEDVNDENNTNYKVANLIIRSQNLFKNSFE